MDNTKQELEKKYPFHVCGRIIITLLVVLWGIILAILFGGCNETHPVNGYKVKDSMIYHNTCKYWLQPIKGFGNLYIQDTCNLYRIGDTIWFTPNYKHSDKPVKIDLNNVNDQYQKGTETINKTSE